MAQIGWIDFSTADRKKVALALAAMRPEGQLDELGVGRIRDVLADRLFPGISTIQTRAKYFFIVSYILRDFMYLPANEKSRTTAARYLEDREHEIKNILRQKYGGQRNTGVIGITLTERQRIARAPSEIYWVGLSRFGCIKNDGLTLSRILQNLNHINVGLSGKKKKEEADDDHDAGHDVDFLINVPVAPQNWIETLDISLTYTEANFLKSQFTHPANLHLKDSVLDVIFKINECKTALLDAKYFSAFVKTVIELEGFPDSLRENLIAAHDFALIIHGAHLLYNHLLQEHFYSDSYAGRYLDEWHQWRTQLRLEMIDFERFDIDSLNLANTDSKQFAQTWWKLVKDEAIELTAFVNVVKHREFAVKGKKARLRNSKNIFPEMKPDGWIGLRPLQYRFGNTKTILKDIITGLANG